MYEIKLNSEHALIIREALRLYKQQWSGGHPQEQMDIMYLETEFTKIVLESHMDAGN
jgi:hypothetical protein|tara:strand:+ start:52 stop:222 length:171 start_codon:yes stop_codon:yes gene_type:complete